MLGAFLIKGDMVLPIQEVSRANRLIVENRAPFLDGAIQIDILRIASLM